MDVSTGYDGSNEGVFEKALKPKTKMQNKAGLAGRWTPSCSKDCMHHVFTDVCMC